MTPSKKDTVNYCRGCQFACIGCYYTDSCPIPEKDKAGKKEDKTVLGKLLHGLRKSDNT